MSEKLIGYLLLITGIVIMFFSSISVYEVFTKQKKPVQLFNFSGISIDLNQIISGINPSQASQLPSGQKAQIIPPEILNDTTNIFAHVMLMGFLVSLGYKIASLGTYLMRSITVKLQAQEKKE